MIDLTHVSKFYQTVCGVNDVHLQLEKGCYGLIGPNGSGKTTLINLITGNLRPSLGKVRLFGVSPWEHRHVLKRVGLCPATDILIPNVTAFQWVKYTTALYGYSPRESAERSESSLTVLGMLESMHKPIGAYSLGMRQRTKIAQSIAHDPELLILDEPFNGLDPIGRHDVGQFLSRWSKDQKSIILASHVLHEVEAVTSNFLLIHGGRLLASGRADEVQTMLSGFPQQIKIGGQGMTALAKKLLEQPWVQQIEILQADRLLQVGVGEPLAFFGFLKDLSETDGIQVQTLDSPDGNLSAAFDALLRAHRGEMSR